MLLATSIGLLVGEASARRPKGPLQMAVPTWEARLGIAQLTCGLSAWGLVVTMIQGDHRAPPAAPGPVDVVF